MNDAITFRFEPNIELQKNSLVEAWLEIRWKLEDVAPQMKRDPKFDVALGVFYNNVKDKYRDSIPLDANRIPSEMLPHVVRFQFRNGQDGWPLIQLGPGVASINFATEYTWENFHQETLFLREQLLKSYDNALKMETLILRYRNVIPFYYSSGNLVEFLAQKLNLALQYPASIPGNASKPGMLNGISLNLSFNLRDEIGVGNIRVNTGTFHENKKNEAILVELEIISNPELSTSLVNVEQFTDWLTLAHSVIHDWYFSLIDGELRKEFSKEGM